MQVASVWDFYEFMDAGKSGSFEDYSHRLIEYAFSELLVTLAED